MLKWNPKIPFDFGTAVYCLLMGYVLSIPIGHFPSDYLLLEPPALLKRLYSMFILPAFVALPCWSFLVVRDYKPLPTLSVIVIVLFILAGLFFPTIS